MTVADIRPFAALRPCSGLAKEVCELPYDVMSTDEARAIAASRPLSFLHVSKPEIDLPPAVPQYDPAVYRKGRENFQRLIEERVLQQDSEAAFYLYRQIMGTHSQTGLVALASCEEYRANIIKKHELTRLDKEDDRVRHIEILDAQTGPVFLTYRARAEIEPWQELAHEEAPEIDFTAPDGVQHSSWTLREPSTLAAIRETFAQVPCLYIADGHHRSAAAVRVYQSRQGRGTSGYFLSVIFPHHQMQILPYHRVVQLPKSLGPDLLLARLGEVFISGVEGSPRPAKPRQVGFYFQRQWRSFQFRPELEAGLTQADKLDVALLQRYVLDPIFGIKDPRSSQMLQFVGGIRGTGELEKLVNTGLYDCAFSMHPASIHQLMDIADAGGILSLIHI